MVDFREALKRKISDLKEAEQQSGRAAGKWSAKPESSPTKFGTSRPQRSLPGTLPGLLPPAAADPGAGVSRRAEPPRTDQELFFEAVRGVSRDVILEKYSTRPAEPAPPKAPAEQRREEEALFESFVGPLDKKLRSR